MDGDRMKTIPFLYVDENILFYKEIEEARCVTAFLYSCNYIVILHFFEIDTIMKYEYIHTHKQ